MTGLLASVTGIDEAHVALQAGADIIDLKNPAEGALGALPLPTIQAVVRTVNGVRPVSTTVGDLPPDSKTLCAAVEAARATGVAYIKLGLFEPQRSRDYLDILAPYAEHGARLIAVLFADRLAGSSAAEWDGHLQPIARAGFAGVMLDTADKACGGLRRHAESESLADFVRSARYHGLLCGLAGSLSVKDIPPLLELDPDYLGFRTALCAAAQRRGSIDPAATAQVRQCIPGGMQPTRRVSAA